MEVREIFRKLETNQYMPDFDYRTRFTFQTLFYTSPCSYRCCPCAFQNEFLDYIAENGDINEKVYEKIIQSIIAGKCPHVSDTTPEYWQQETRISAVGIAIAVETEQAEIAVADAEAQSVEGDPQNVYRPPTRNKIFRVSAMKSKAIFNLQLHDIALIKRKFHRVKFHCQNYIQYNIRTFGAGCSYTPVTVLNSIVGVNKIRFLDAIVQANNNKLLKEVLEIKSEVNPLVEFYIDREAFHYVLKQSLTELQDVFLDYFRTVKSPRIVLYGDLNRFVDYVVIYNHHVVLDKLLRLGQFNTSDSYSGVDVTTKTNDPLQVITKCRNLCNVFNRPDCEKVLHKYDKPLGENQNIVEQARLVLNLIGPDLLYFADFKDEISIALKKVPDIHEFLIKLLHSHRLHCNPQVMKLLLELNMFTDDNGCFKDNYSESVFKQLFAYCIHSYERETVKLLTEANLDIESLIVSTHVVDLDHIDSLIVSDHVVMALKNDSEQFKRSIVDSGKTFYMRKLQEEELFRTDTQEHGRLGFEGEDFALNFTTPFLLECGLPTTREVLEKFLGEPLHPAEHVYLQAYIQENFDRPKPLAKICRHVVRKHFKGLKLHKFMEISSCPQIIKDYILMKYLLD